jgi:hypothetical protein
MRTCPCGGLFVAPRTLAAMICAITVMACSSSSGSTADASSDGGADASVDASPDAPGDVVASATIGPAGGELALANGGRLVVPAGALADDQLLEAVPLPAPEGQEFWGLGAFYRFQPEGLQFQIPAVVELALSGDGLPTPTAFGPALAWRSGQEPWTRLDASWSEDGKRLVGTVLHFSEGGPAQWPVACTKDADCGGTRCAPGGVLLTPVCTAPACAYVEEPCGSGVCRAGECAGDCFVDADCGAPSCLSGTVASVPWCDGGVCSDRQEICTGSLACVAGACQGGCAVDADCGAPSCASSTVAVLPRCDGGACVEDQEVCTGSLTCHGGTCSPACETDADCGAPSCTSSSVAVEPWCNNKTCDLFETVCTGNQTCFGGTCTGPCTTDEECGAPACVGPFKASQPWCDNGTCAIFEEVCAGATQCLAGACVGTCETDVDCGAPTCASATAVGRPSCFDGLCSFLPEPCGDGLTCEDGACVQPCPAGQDCSPACCSSGGTWKVAPANTCDAGLPRFAAAACAELKCCVGFGATYRRYQVLPSFACWSGTYVGEVAECQALSCCFNEMWQLAPAGVCDGRPETAPVAECPGRMDASVLLSDSVRYYAPLPDGHVKLGVTYIVDTANPVPWEPGLGEHVTFYSLTNWGCSSFEGPIEWAATAPFAGTLEGPQAGAFSTELPDCADPSRIIYCNTVGFTSGVGRVKLTGVLGTLSASLDATRYEWPNGWSDYSDQYVSDTETMSAQLTRYVMVNVVFTQPNTWASCGNTGTLQVEGDPLNFPGTNVPRPVGAVVTATVVPDAGKAFQFWFDGKSGTVYAQNPVVATVPLKGLDLRPYCVPSP